VAPTTFTSTAESDFDALARVYCARTLHIKGLHSSIFLAQPEPFLSVSRFVSSLRRAINHQLCYTQLTPFTFPTKKC